MPESETPTFADPALEGTGKGPSPSVVMPTSTLDDLRADLAAEVIPPPVRLHVPGRPRWHATFDADLDAQLVAKWQLAATDKRGRTDNLAVTLVLLANQNTALEYDEQVVADTSGEMLTVRSPEFLALLPQAAGNRPTDGIRWLFGLDGHVMAAGTAVLERAGYTDELTADPIKPS